MIVFLAFFFSQLNVTITEINIIISINNTKWRIGQTRIPGYIRRGIGCLNEGENGEDNEQ